MIPRCFHPCVHPRAPRRAVAVAAVVVFGWSASATEPGPASPAPESSRRSNHILVRARDSMSATLVDAAERVDRFFGDERLEEDNKGTRLTVRFGLRQERRNGASFEQKVSLRLALPQLENRLQFIVDNIVEGDDPGDTSGVRDAFSDSTPDTGLRWIIRELERFRLTSDVGARWSREPQLFYRLRARKIHMIGDWELMASQSLFAYTADGVGETTELRWVRRLADDWLFRSLTRVTWRDQRSGVEPAQTFEIIGDPRESWAQAFRIRGTWPETPHTREALYAGEWVLRRRVHWDWLYLEVRPGVEFAQAFEYNANPYIVALLEVIFGDAPPPGRRPTNGRPGRKAGTGEDPP